MNSTFITMLAILGSLVVAIGIVILIVLRITTLRYEGWLAKDNYKLPLSYLHSDITTAHPEYNKWKIRTVRNKIIIEFSYDESIEHLLEIPEEDFN